MSFSYIRQIPDPKEVLRDLPLPDDLKLVKAARDREIIRLFQADKTDRFVLIIGPCSAHDEEAVCDYVGRLAALQAEVKEKILLIPRIYTNKPRTTGAGYKGMVHQPDHQKEANMVVGLKAIRTMHIRAMKESHLTAADEMLYPGNYPYLEDILSYVTVGARSVENQQHRLTISGLDVPAGMKNPTGGSVEVLLNSIQAAQLPHTFIYNRWEVRTSGNPLTHSVLRGAVDRHGQSIPNYHYEDMVRFAESYTKRALANPAVIVDTNHANSGKKYSEQPRIALEIMHSRKQSPLLRRIVRGLMIESYLVAGAQDPSGNEYGKSITDPCLGWDESARLVRRLADLI